MNLPDSNVVWYNQRQLLLIRSEFSSWISFHVKRISSNKKENRESFDLKYG